MKEKDLKVGTIITHPKYLFITRIVDITDDSYIIDNRIESIEWFKKTSTKPDVTVWPKRLARRIKPVKIFISLFRYNERFTTGILPGLHIAGDYVRTQHSLYHNSIFIVKVFDGRVHVLIAKVNYNNPVEHYLNGVKFGICTVYSTDMQYVHELQDFCEKHKLQDIACSHSFFPLCELDTANVQQVKKYSKDNTFNQKINVINKLRKARWAAFPINNYYNYED